MFDSVCANVGKSPWSNTICVAVPGRCSL